MRAIAIVMCAAALGAGAGCRCFHAKPRTDPRAVTPMPLAEADRDGDGRVSGAEFSQLLKQRAQETLDADRDGFVTREEWGNVNPSPDWQTAFTKVDADRDGRLSARELADIPAWGNTSANAFRRFDLDRSGFLTPDEFTGRPMFRLLGATF